MSLTSNGTIEIHPSDLVSWTKCEKKRIQRFWNPEPVAHTRTHIAEWVGSAVHARVAGLDDPPRPKEIVFDAFSPTFTTAQAQVSVMAEQVTRTIADSLSPGSIVEYEVPFEPLRMPGWPQNVVLVGTADMVVTTMDRNITAIVDIKTSQNFEYAWLQLGAYGLLWNRGEPSGIPDLGVLHCPRPDYGMMNREQVLDISFQETSVNARKCADEALSAIRRIIDLVTDRDTAVASPGIHCKWCEHPYCVIREEHIPTTYYGDKYV